MRPLSAGEMNQQVTIRAVVRTEDEYGGATETTTDAATVWAKKEGLGGTEQFTAMQTGMTSPHRFRIWHRDDLTGATELLSDGLRYDVRSVADPDGRRRELVIIADEGRA